MRLCSMLLPHTKNSILNWYNAYHADPDTSYNFLHIQLNQNK